MFKDGRSDSSPKSCAGAAVILNGAVRQVMGVLPQSSVPQMPFYHPCVKQHKSALLNVTYRVYKICRAPAVSMKHSEAGDLLLTSPASAF